MKQETRFQIGEVAKRVGLSLRTVRYFEEVGLVAPSARTVGGFRLYSEADVERLFVVKGMKPLGLSLDEIREVLELLERSADPEGIELDDLVELVARMEGFAERADERIKKLVRHLNDGRKLRRRIGERLAECAAVLQHASAGVMTSTSEHVRRADARFEYPKSRRQ
jgi:DNA-binding transcriptional MerR regulator